MSSLFIWILLVKEALSSISIKVDPSVVMIGKSDIDIRCIVDGTNLSRVISIQLNRSNKTVVVITRNGVTWEDAALDNQTEVTVNASTGNVTSSYLHLEISKTVVRYPDDMGSYQCLMTAIYLQKGLNEEYSQTMVLTGIHETTIDIHEFTASTSTEQHETEGTFESKITTETFKDKTTKDNLDDDTTKILKMYRSIMIPVGLLISTILAFVIIREIRLYYFASNGTD